MHINGEHIRVLPPCEKHLKDTLKQYDAKLQECESLTLTNDLKLMLFVRRELISRLLDQRDLEKVASEHALWNRVKEEVTMDQFKPVFDRAWFRIHEHATP